MATNPGGWGRGQPPIRTPRGGEYQAWERGSVGPPQGQPSTLPYIQQIGSIGKGIVEELKCALTLYSPCNIYYWTIWILNWNIVFCNLFHWDKGKYEREKVFIQAMILKSCIYIVPQYMYYMYMYLQLWIKISLCFRDNYRWPSRHNEHTKQLFVLPATCQLIKSDTSSWKPMYNNNDVYKWSPEPIFTCTFHHWKSVSIHFQSKYSSSKNVGHYISDKLLARCPDISSAQTKPKTE